MSLEQFLDLPEAEPPCEYIDGEVVQKVSPNIPHSALAAWLAARFLGWASNHELCVVGVEGRHISPDGKHIYFPDVHLTRMSRMAGHETESPMTVTPDVAVEVLSPDDRTSDVLRRVELYVEMEIPAFLLVDPMDRSVREYRGGLPARIHAEGAVVDLSPVLPGFTFDTAELFAVIPG